MGKKSANGLGGILPRVFIGSTPPYSRRFATTNMEFPPGDWPCVGIEDFELAVPRNPGRLGIEVMTQARVNGRIIDHFRVAIGGSEILKVNFNTNNIFLVENTPAVNLSYEIWPRDISIRRNMVTSEWLDVATLLASRDVSVIVGGLADPEVPDGNAALLAAMDEQPKPMVSASIRWAVGASIDGRMELVLQSFPSTAAILSGKPAFRG